MRATFRRSGNLGGVGRPFIRGRAALRGRPERMETSMSRNRTECDRVKVSLMEILSKRENVERYSKDYRLKRITPPWGGAEGAGW